MQGFIIQEMIAQQQAAMEKMSPDQRKKFDEAMAKSARLSLNPKKNLPKPIRNNFLLHFFILIYQFNDID